MLFALKQDRFETSVYCQPFFVDPHVRSFPCFEIVLFEMSELFQLFIPYSVGTTNSLGSLHLYFVLGCDPSNIFSIGY